MAFSYGTIKVWQDHDLTFTIEGAKSVGPKHFVTFMKMLVAFLEGDAPGVAQDPEIPVKADGTCPECDSHKVTAKNDLRKCSVCDYVWRVA